MDAEHRLTPEQWCAHYGVTILDPDGWRTAGAPAWDQPISLAEFSARAMRCTVDTSSPGWDRMIRDLAAEPPTPPAPAADRRTYRVRTAATWQQWSDWLDAVPTEPDENPHFARVRHMQATGETILLFQGETAFTWICPGCGMALGGDLGEQPVSGWDKPCWVNTGTPQRPTLTPSLGCPNWRRGDCEGHWFLRDGELVPA
jgi:hypothetical protein